MKRCVVLYDTLHRSRERRGTGTATLESKPEQQLYRLANEPLLKIFLDFCKAYDFLDRGRCLEILRA